jgi:hypothetical protein
VRAEVLKGVERLAELELLDPSYVATLVRKFRERQEYVLPAW